ncbi:hypothetical protein QO058_17175 [Bosea vestrisii]|uniref:hypothetical protein n=1 Tax=Bosea vestrisii TaxID=151416 RepID=UPI0024DF7E19|nr:hypothetical protein [Bosea vestrisii]WID94566.1 hypothetical protein QO058_17175 [Bosea vestrisii]
MALSAFRTVRGRLLALMVAIVLPIACLTAAAAVATYRTVFEAIQTAQTRAADDFAVRTRVWYRGALRSLVASATAIRALPPPSDICDRIAEKTIAAVSGYEALLLRASGRPDCLGGLGSSIAHGEIIAIANQLATHPPIKLWGGTEFAKARYDQVAIAGRSYLAIYTQFDEGDALLLTKPDPLDDVFDLGGGDTGMMAALVRRGARSWLRAVVRRPTPPGFRRLRRCRPRRRNGRPRAWPGRAGPMPPGWSQSRTFTSSSASTARPSKLPRPSSIPCCWHHCSPSLCSGWST